jgi:hypothetical protein
MTPIYIEDLIDLVNKSKRYTLGYNGGSDLVIQYETMIRGLEDLLVKRRFDSPQTYQQEK